MLMGTMLSCGGPIGSQTESLSLSSWSYNQVAETDQSKNPSGTNERTALMGEAEVKDVVIEPL